MGLGLAPAFAASILNYLFRATSFTPPVTYYLKLHTGDPGAAGTANVAGNTTRKAVVLGTAATGGVILNTATISWTTGEVTTSETYSHWSLWSASTAGTFEWSGALNAPRAVAAGTAVDVAVGGLSASFTVAS